MFSEPHERVMLTFWLECFREVPTTSRGCVEKYPETVRWRC
jgi:hypothetical protein